MASMLSDSRRLSANSSESTHTRMPPARLVVPPGADILSMITTSAPFSLADMAEDRPAMPAPITSTSVVCSTAVFSASASSVSGATL